MNRMPPLPDLMIEPAVRAWALTDDTVAAALAEVDAERIAFCASMLADIGLKDPHLPQAIYAAYIGLDDLTSKGAGDIAQALPALFQAVMASVPRSTGN